MVRYSYRPNYLHADLLNRHYNIWRKFLKDSDSWDTEQIQTYEINEIRRIVSHAYTKTKGYRELYNSCGITDKSIRIIDDFRRLPFITKEMIRDRLEDFSVNMQGRKYVTTSGSSGIPLGFYRDHVAFAKELASKAHQYSRISWQEGDRQFVFRGIVISSKNHIKYYPRFNELRCSSYHLTTDSMELYRTRAFEYRPDWIKCYPSSGYLFAKFLKESQRPFPPVKGILCSSENLYDYQKKLLQEIFNARVYSHYGHYEMAALAGFCEHEDTYHVLPQYGYVELIGADNRPVTTPGAVGEIVATSFIMHATPFIRYKTGDLAKLKGWGCSSCGRPYQIWEAIEGRLQEFIVTANGRYISMVAMTMHDNIFDHIKQFQFYQDTRGYVIFKFIPNQTCDEKVIADMKRRLLIKLGTDVDLEMQRVDEIPLTLRGKHRPLIQKLKLQFGDA